MASTYITRTVSSAGNQKTWTLSFWFKRTSNVINGDAYIFSYAQGSGQARGAIDIDATNQNFLVQFNPTGSAWTTHTVTSRKIRDVSAWYHIVVKCDTTQATDSNRLKVYINGENQTLDSYPAQNFDTGFNASYQHTLGRYEDADSSYLDGLLTHIHWTDGYAYDASSFGETDSTSGIWKAKTSPSVTYGTNGFFLKLENSGAMGTDSSGNTNTFTVSGTLTQNVDTPDNNFCTWNPLTQNGGTYLNGNTTRTGGDDTGASMGVTNGKWYWEMKKANTTAGNHFGICSTSSGFNNSSLQMLNGESGSVGASIWLSLTGTAATGYGNAAGFSNVNYSGISSVSIANGDIVGCALDISTSSGTLTFYKNGSSLGAATFTYDQKTPVFPFIRNNSGATTDTNFGSGFFGTTAVASANADGNGVGKMEYAVPSGYYTLNTKNLKEFG